MEYETTWNEEELEELEEHQNQPDNTSVSAEELDTLLKELNL